MERKFKNYRYEFVLAAGETKVFVLRLEYPSLRMEQPPQGESPSWTRLSCEKCPGCPLTGGEEARCPVAVNLAPILDQVHDLFSTDMADITITCDDREYFKRTQVQYGVRSMIGMCMATSGCPILDKLRPMAYIHLPFPNMEETLFRSLMMYLTAQYFRMGEGQEPDWNLESLSALYREISRVNLAFSKRLQHAGVDDAILNAISNLDTHGNYTAMAIGQDYLNDLKEMFEPFLEPRREEG